MWYAWEEFGGWSVFNFNGRVYTRVRKLNIPRGVYRTKEEAEALAVRLNKHDPEALKLVAGKTERRWPSSKMIARVNGLIE